MPLEKTLPYTDFDGKTVPSHVKFPISVTHNGRTFEIIILGEDEDDCRKYLEGMNRSNITESTTYYTQRAREAEHHILHQFPKS